MEIFWNTIAAYNAATWPAQIGFTLVAAMLLVLLYLRPTPAVRIAMKLFMAFLNFWIAGVYYMIYCRPREYHGMLALFWAIMGGIWIYELLVKHASLERTGQHNAFAILLLVMPLILSTLLAGAGPRIPHNDLARHALFGGGLHHRTDARLLGAGQYRAGDVPLPLGTHRSVESLLLRHPRRLPAGVQHHTCTLHLLSGVCPKQRRPADETLGPCARCVAHYAVPGHRHLLYFHVIAPA